MKPSHFSNELLLVFQKKHIKCNHTNLAQSSVYQKNIDFLKNSRLNSHKNAWNQCKTLNCNEIKPFFQWITASFSEKNIWNTITLTWPKKVFTKKTLIFSKAVDYTHIKIVKTNVKSWIAMKPSHFSNE